MRSVALLTFAGLILDLAGCVAQRYPPREVARFAAISAEPIHAKRPHTIFHPPVSKRRCFGLSETDRTLQEIVEEALSEFPDANAIVLAKFEDEGRCLRLTGFAARIE